MTGPASADMVMLRLSGPEAVAALPKSKWGIPEPPLPSPFEQERDDGTYAGRMDLVLVPGVSAPSWEGKADIGHDLILTVLRHSRSGGL